MLHLFKNVFVLSRCRPDWPDVTGFNKTFNKNKTRVTVSWRLVLLAKCEKYTGRGKNRGWVNVKTWTLSFNIHVAIIFEAFFLGVGVWKTTLTVTLCHRSFISPALPRLCGLELRKYVFQGRSWRSSGWATGRSHHEATTMSHGNRDDEEPQ